MHGVFLIYVFQIKKIGDWGFKGYLGVSPKSTEGNSQAVRAVDMSFYGYEVKINTKN